MMAMLATARRNLTFVISVTSIAARPRQIEGDVGGAYEMVNAKPLSSEPRNVSVARIHRDEARAG